MLNIIKVMEEKIKDMNKLNCTVVSKNGCAAELRLSKEEIEIMKSEAKLVVTGINVRGKATEYVLYL